MGGGFERFPERYLACDPNLLQSSCVDISIMHGNKDKCVEISQALSYCENANDNVEEIYISQADHFSMLPHEGLWHQEHWSQLKNVIKNKIIALG
jgi:alpha/beta superfamily hydrolase